jgi:NAD(P)-dependent dehydrogenase (short-subunit alcohol dehydrogenase family)
LRVLVLVTAGRLADRVAIITGAGSGIGRASAILFATEGACVVCADRSGREQDTAAEIGDRAVAVAVDVSNGDDVQRMINIAEEKFGRLDVLFNNAGVSGPKRPIVEQTEETFDMLVAVNLKGVFLGMKYGIEGMLRHGGGAIVNTASAAGIVGWGANALYGATKAGVIQMTKAAAIDYAEQGIRINAVCPGMTWTGMVSASENHPVPPPGTRPPGSVPMARWGLASELASAALFLASDDASFITGAILPVDGGYTVP